MPRVVSGKFRGIKLQTLAGDKTRPSGDRVKEAIFSQLSPRIYASRFLDLFSGSGQIGLEALSRGASLVVLVEEMRQATRVIEKNLELCKQSKTALSDLASKSEAEPSLCLLQMTAEKAVKVLAKAGLSFDLIYFDPPWSELASLVNKLSLDLREISSADAVLIIESEGVCPEPQGWELIASRSYGRTLISRFRKSDSL
ncbi:MAG: 16S rRNA (guanine(966)-N(2))-methyltransferase RsmD [Eubacteriales bacterium]|nr:16S rRNA (guanine(966)-N(2))-methyltransferase RsmD [Eubacteriales bacterium]